MTNLTNQRQVFVEKYVRSGNHLDAAKKTGYKDTHILRNQACKIRRECADEITDELHRNFAEIALRALCMMNGLRAIPQPSELLYFNQVKKFTKRRLTMGNTLDPAPQASV